MNFLIFIIRNIHLHLYFVNISLTLFDTLEIMDQSRFEISMLIKILRFRLYENIEIDENFMKFCGN